MLGFNWHKNYFVLTKEGYWYYFNNRDEPKPEAAFYLPGYRVEVSVDPATGVMTTCLHAKNKGWLSVSGPTKVAVRVDATGLSVSNGLVLSEWKTALLSFAAPEAR